MNLSERATAEMRKPYAERDYSIVDLDRERWYRARVWLETKPKRDIRKLLAEMDDEERDDMRRRLNKKAGLV